MAYQVFLCHCNADKAAVKRIAEQLKARGIEPYLDEWSLRPGIPWPRELERAIRTIPTAAIFIGKEGYGPWQTLEYEALVGQFAKRQCPIIPVILADCSGTPDVPAFLEGFTWVDFRKSDPDPLERLIWGVTGHKREAPPTPAPPRRWRRWWFALAPVLLGALIAAAWPRQRSAPSPATAAPPGSAPATSAAIAPLRTRGGLSFVAPRDPDWWFSANAVCLRDSRISVDGQSAYYFLWHGLSEASPSVATAIQSAGIDPLVDVVEFGAFSRRGAEFLYVVLHLDEEAEIDRLLRRLGESATAGTSEAPRSERDGRRRILSYRSQYGRKAIGVDLIPIDWSLAMRADDRWSAQAARATHVALLQIEEDRVAFATPALSDGAELIAEAEAGITVEGSRCVVGGVRKPQVLASGERLEEARFIAFVPPRDSDDVGARALEWNASPSVDVWLRLDPPLSPEEVKRREQEWLAGAGEKLLSVAPALFPGHDPKTVVQGTMGLLDAAFDSHSEHSGRLILSLATKNITAEEMANLEATGRH